MCHYHLRASHKKRVLTYQWSTVHDCQSMVLSNKKKNYACILMDYFNSFKTYWGYATPWYNIVSLLSCWGFAGGYLKMCFDLAPAGQLVILPYLQQRYQPVGTSSPHFGAPCPWAYLISSFNPPLLASVASLAPASPHSGAVLPWQTFPIHCLLRSAKALLNHSFAFSFSADLAASASSLHWCCLPC